ncbi:hypothetical protein B2G71_21210 [Novosphingobium sp. PC22D]|nr:hypothetical protein B2G71_21210 [Novosphingobium sp. PC22D]
MGSRQANPLIPLNLISDQALRPDRKRELIDAVRQDWQVTIRRACTASQFNRSTYHYQSRRTDPAFLKKRIKEICETHARYGYRRVYHILRRDGWHVNMKKVYRLYRELDLQLRNKTPKRRVKAMLREDRAPPIMLANSAGETSPPDLVKAENSRPEWSKVG